MQYTNQTTVTKTRTHSNLLHIASHHRPLSPFPLSMKVGGGSGFASPTLFQTRHIPKSGMISNLRKLVLSLGHQSDGNSWKPSEIQVTHARSPMVRATDLIRRVRTIPNSRFRPLGETKPVLLNHEPTRFRFAGSLINTDDLGVTTPMAASRRVHRYVVHDT